MLPPTPPQPIVLNASHLSHFPSAFLRARLRIPAEQTRCPSPPGYERRISGASAIGAASGDETTEEKAFRAVVQGRVQGVGFRYFVLGVARPLGVAGTVRNLPDGSVEVLASGSPAVLESLIARLREGPAMSRVTDVRVEWGIDLKAHSPDPADHNFSIS